MGGEGSLSRMMTIEWKRTQKSREKDGDAFQSK